MKNKAKSSGIQIEAYDGQIGAKIVNMLRLLIILPCLLLMFQPLNAKVEAPNYHFNLDTLNDFFPGNTVVAIEMKFGKGESMGKSLGLETLKFNVSEKNYKFPVIVQVREGVIEDFLARLPSYFLHDTFFQALINRNGKQNFYKKTGEEAFYVWEKGSLKHVYSAACTITCFPIFYSVMNSESERTSLLQKMKKANN